MGWLKRFFLLLIVLFLSGCTLLGTYMDPQNPAPTYRVNGQLVRVAYVQLNPDWVLMHNTTPTYHVGPYDILNIIVWNNPEITTPTTQLSRPSQSGYLVSDRGTISFPFAGTIKVAGLSLPKIQTLIERKISKYIRNPQVLVRVVVFRSQEAQLLGETGSQITIRLTDKPTSLLDALNQAGGTSLTAADTSRIYVIRGNMKRLTVYALNAKSPQMMMLAQRFYIKNNDIIYVPPLAITNWNSVISQLMPTFGVPGTVKGTAATFE